MPQEPTIVELYPVRKIARKPLKRARTRLRRKISKRPKAKPIKRLRAELWELCKQITRKKYGNTCYTCGAQGLSGGNWHTGHFIPRSICGLFLRYDLRNLRPQCYRCNISLSGNGSSFYRNLVSRDGQYFVDEIFSDKNRQTKETVIFFKDKIMEYQQIIEELEKDHTRMDRLKKVITKHRDAYHAAVQ